MPINQRQLTRLNESARSVFGKDVANFLCPIELEDTKDTLCNGHILNGAIANVSRKTVVQCSGIDSYFGSKIEPELIFLLALRDLPDIDLSKLFRRPGPLQVIDRNGLPVEAFFGGRNTANFQRLELHGSDGPFEVVHLREARFDEDDKNAVVRKSTVIPDGAITGALMKAAYLARFEMEGYEFVNHLSTECVRLALCNFFQNGGTKESAKEFFGPFAGCANTATPDKRIGDTLVNRRVVIHSTRYGSDEVDFAITCLFAVGNDLITVALPHHNGIGDPEYASRYYEKHLKRINFCSVEHPATSTSSG